MASLRLATLALAAVALAGCGPQSPRLEAVRVCGLFVIYRDPDGRLSVNGAAPIAKDIALADVCGSTPKTPIPAQKPG